MNFRSWRLRITFFVAAILLALVGNWARAWLVVMIGHLSEMRYGTGDDHVWYGWVFFGLVMGGLFWMGGRWKEDVSEAQVATVSRKIPGTLFVVPSKAAVNALWIMTLSTVAAVSVFKHQMTQVDPRSGLKPKFEAVIGAITDNDLEAPPQITGAREIVMARRSISSGSFKGSLEATSAYFAQQTEGYEMIAWGNSPAPDRHRYGWAVVRSAPQMLEAGLISHQVQELLLARGQERRLMWSWYSISGTAAATELHGKLVTALALSRGRGDHSCMHVLSVLVDTQKVGALDASALQEARRSMAELASQLPCL
jgi:EpsI family protein